MGIKTGPPPRKNMEQNNIKPGMVVKLKSGSPLMTADCVREGKMFCIYFIGTEAKWITISHDALIEIKEYEIQDAKPSDTD